MTWEEISRLHWLIHEAILIEKCYINMGLIRNVYRDVYTKQIHKLKLSMLLPALFSGGKIVKY